MSKTRILVLGITGMLGHDLFNYLSKSGDFSVYGTVRSLSGLEACFDTDQLLRIRTDVDADNFDSVIRALASIQPDIVINCIGLIKQLPIGSDPLTAITINAQLPHRISMICRAANARLIHISTDCVFDGKNGNYIETDATTPVDLYGQTKLLGEVTYPHCITLRSSIIGHELKGRLGLLEWFLAQNKKVEGFAKAIYSGFPTVEMARIIAEYVIPNKELSGLYHVASDPISKYNLLQLIAQQYGKEIEIEPFAEFVCNRSLNSSRFRQATGYSSPSWSDLVVMMHADKVER